MFTHNDFKETADHELINRLVAFTSCLETLERELLVTLVMGRDDLLDFDEVTPVSDEEIDALLREGGIRA